MCLVTYEYIFYYYPHFASEVNLFSVIHAKRLIELFYIPGTIQHALVYLQEE